MNRNLVRSLFIGMALTLSGCMIELQHDLLEQDANDIYVLLQKNSIEPKKIVQAGGNEPRYTISVSKADVRRAAELLREHSLPRPTADGLSVFKKMKGMIPTQTEERAMLLEALAGEITNTLNQVPGILEARAVVNLPEVNDLTQPDKKPMPSASVFVKFRPIDGKAPVSEEAIKEWVTGTVTDMKKEAVKVMMVPASFGQVDESPENRLVTVLNFTMTAASADQFKVMVGVGGIAVLAMAGLTGFAFTRKLRGNGARGRARGGTNAGQEG
jgi:type III secretion protein J